MLLGTFSYLPEKGAVNYYYNIIPLSCGNFVTQTIVQVKEINASAWVSHAQGFHNCNGGGGKYQRMDSSNHAASICRCQHQSSPRADFRGSLAPVDPFLLDIQTDTFPLWSSLYPENTSMIALKLLCASVIVHVSFLCQSVHSFKVHNGVLFQLCLPSAQHYLINVW